MAKTRKRRETNPDRKIKQAFDAIVNPKTPKKRRTAATAASHAQRLKERRIRSLLR